MPIEIKELYIKAVVSDTTRQQNSQPIKIDEARLKREIVKECVKEVIKTLKEKNER